MMKPSLKLKRSGGFEPHSFNVRGDASSQAVLSPAALPSPDIKIEMVEPKIDPDDFGLDFDVYKSVSGITPLTQENVNDDNESKAELASLVIDRPICPESYGNDPLKCRMTNEIVKFKCFHCSQQTKWKTSLRRHIETRHLADEIERRICTGCGKSLKNKYGLKIHKKYCEKWNNEVVKHECPICFYVSKWRAGLKLHIKRIHSVDIPSAICAKCGKSFENVGALKCHLKYCGKSKHDIVKFKCFYCSHEAKWKNNLIIHIETQHLVDELKRLTCTACGKSLKNKYSLKLHMKYCEKSNNEIVKHKCPMCIYKTKWKNQLKAHVRRIHSDETPNAFTCTECTKSYGSEGALKCHLKYCGKTNDEIVKFKCFHCCRETKWKKSLRRHIETQHVVETERSTCTCGKSLDSNSLKEHKKHCEKANSEIVKHKCPYCILETKWKKNLMRHLRKVHPGETPKSPTCNGCGKSCRDSESLEEHQQYCKKTSEISVKHKCPHCLYESKSKSALTQHVKRSHTVKTTDPSTVLASAALPLPLSDVKIEIVRSKTEFYDIGLDDECNSCP